MSVANQVRTEQERESLTVAPGKAARSGPLAGVPAAPAGAIRVVSYNVLNAAPLKQPGPFARLFAALNPDVLLFQEWDEGDALELQDWFVRHVGGRWHVRQSAGRGVAVVSPHPLTRWGPFRVDYQATLANPPLAAQYFGPVVALAGALVQTPHGPVAAAAVHLTACGGHGTPEDQRRVCEAELINHALQAPPADLLVMGGDLNLVGSTTPRECLRSHLDLGGADLAVAEPLVLGSGDHYTWRNPETIYPPGRLDWMFYSSQAARLGQSFVLDTARLGPEALQRSGLLPTDTAHSDHLPVVLDLVPTPLPRRPR